MATKWRQVMVAIDRIVWTKQKIPHRRSIKNLLIFAVKNIKPVNRTAIICRHSVESPFHHPTSLDRARNYKAGSISIANSGGGGIWL